MSVLTPKAMPVIKPRLAPNPPLPKLRDGTLSIIGPSGVFFGQTVGFSETHNITNQNPNNLWTKHEWTITENILLPTVNILESDQATISFTPKSEHIGKTLKVSLILRYDGGDMLTTKTFTVSSLTPSSMTCPIGMKVNKTTNKCEIDKDCPPGQIWNNNTSKCETPAKPSPSACQEGYYRLDGKCVIIPEDVNHIDGNCPPGYHINQTKNMCEHEGHAIARLQRGETTPTPTPPAKEPEPEYMTYIALALAAVAVYVVTKKK